MTSAHLDHSEHVVKEERMDEMDEMLDDEMPVTIDIPDGDDAEVDPLMPVEIVKSEDTGESDKFPASGESPADDSSQPAMKQELDLPGDGFSNESSVGFGVRAEIKSEDSDSISIDEDCGNERIHDNAVDSDNNISKKPTVSAWSSRDITLVNRIPSKIGQASQRPLQMIPKLMRIRPAREPTAPSLSSLVPIAPAIPVVHGQPVVQRGPVLPSLREIPAMSLVNGVISKPAGQTVALIDQGLTTLQSLGSVSVPSSVTAPTLLAVQANSTVQSPWQSTYRRLLPVPASIALSAVQSEPPDSQGTISTSVTISAPFPTAAPKTSAPTMAAGPSLQGQKVPPNKKSVSVTQILKNPFNGGRWTSEQQLAILTLPRPTPNMESSPSVSTKSFYDNNPWLCGCTKLKKFFCWPCLLFLYHSPESVVWCVPATAVTTSDILAQTLQAHEASDQHREAQKKFSSWLENNTPSTPSAPVKKRYRILQIIDKVRKNLKLLSLLVQTICHLKQRSDDAHVEAYYECFAHVVRSSKELQSILRDFQGGTSPESIAAFISSNAQPVEESVKTYMRNRIIVELSNARFVTLFFEDFSSVVDVSTVAVIAHFIDQSGEIQQRVIELMELDTDRSAGKIFQLVRHLVIKHSLSSKLVGYTYSATFLNPAETVDFNAAMQTLCPKSKFFHYQNHDVTGLLFGALSHLNKKFNNFFHMITELRDFFKKHLVSNFYHYELIKSTPSHLEYDFDDNFLTTLRHCFPSVLQTLGRVVQYPEDWDEEVSSRAPIFMAFLQDITNRFLIALISQLNLCVWDLRKALKGKNRAEWKILVEQTLLKFQTIQTYGFEDIYYNSMSPILVKSYRKTNYKKNHLVNVFLEVIRTGTLFLQQRFSTSDFGCVDLEPNFSVDQGGQQCQTSDYFSRVSCTPDQVENFKVEIQHVKTNPMFQNKTLDESLKRFYEFDLAKALPAYAEFLDLAATVPSSLTILQCPIVERVQLHRLDHCRQPVPRETVWMEKELLADIAKSKKLCEAVIDVLTFSDVPNEFSYGKEARAYLGLQ